VFKHTIRLMLIAAFAFALLGCELGGGDGDVAELRDQVANKDSQIASLQAQLSAQGGQAAPETRSRLETVKARGRLVCASRTDVAGYGYLDANGRNIGFDIDLCRAVAAAIFGNGDALEVIPISAAERGPTIQSGDVDMLARTVTWTTTRDSQWGNYTVVTFYDGQGFMVRKDKNIDSALKLGGTSVCVTSGTTTELNLADFFRQNNLELESVVFENTAAVVSAYEQGRCDAFTNDKSQLAALKSGLENPDDHVILPETISKEPLTPVVPHGDDQWLDLVKTVLYVLINAEEFGVTQANVEQMKSHENIQIRRMLGTEGEFGQSDLGLSAGFAVDVLKAVGNYGEVYDRYMGPEGDAFTLERGINELWTNGGLIYAPPLR
jgi:general L-amino acid transport system substrate-binding protein